MSFDLAVDPYCAAEWAEEIGEPAHPPVVNVKTLSGIELAGLCEDAFRDLESESPAFGALGRYQDLVDETEHRQLVRRMDFE